MICLLAYVGGGSGVLAEVCSLAASLDKAHTAMVGTRPDAFVLVLSHSRNEDSCGVTILSHRHGIIANCLCVLANQNSAQPDHRLEFSQCGVTESPENKLNFSTPTALAPPIIGFPLCVNPVIAKAVFLAPNQGPLPIPNSLVSTRVTILLV